MPSLLRQSRSVLLLLLLPISDAISTFLFSRASRKKPLPKPFFPMKKSGFIAASVAAASAAAVSSAPSTLTCTSKVQFPHQEEKNGEKPSSAADKFAPNFDGLRFIETLVTAHR